MAERDTKALSGRTMAGIVASNAVPVAGMVFLGWKAAPIVILYYLDTLVSLVAVAWSHEPPRGGMYAMVVVFGGIFAGWAFFATLGQVTFSWPLVVAGLVQLGTASVASARVRRPTTRRAKADFEEALWQRFSFVMIRWVAAVMLSVAWTPGIVVIYATVTVFYEWIWQPE
jgi:hypothetical protein